MKGYVDAVTTAWTANAGAQAGDIATLYANAGAQSGTIASATTAITTANTAMKGYVDAANTAMKGYVDGQVSSLVDGAPGTLDTLNEIASALGDDANLSVTLTSYIGNVNANIGTANTAMKGYVDGQITTLTSNAAVQAGAIASATTAITTANTAMKGYVDGQVSTLTSNAAVQAGLINDVTVAFNNYSPNAAVASFVTVTPLQPNQGGTGLASSGILGNVLTSDGAGWVSNSLANLLVFSNSLGTSGYQKLPGGLIVQWGNVATPTSSTNITFSTAFPTAAFVLIATRGAPGDTGGVDVGPAVSSLTTSGAVLSTASGDWHYYVVLGN
jgi:hypothetical protein